MSDGFELWLRTVCFQKPTPEAYDLAKDAWENGRAHGRGDTVMVQPITLEQAKRVIEQAGMVYVPIGHLQCVENHLNSVAEENLSAIKWVQGFIKSAQKDDDSAL